MKTWFVFLVVAWTGLSQAKESEEFANKVIQAHKLPSARAAALKRVLTSAQGLTRNIGSEDPNQLQGPNNSWHMASRQSCIDKVIRTGLIKQNPAYEKICGAPWMAPIPQVGQGIESAKTCIDQFEFPGMPCEYPVVWTTSATAKTVCESMGKRVCNSHEWEGACGGSEYSLSDYAFEIGDRKARRAYTNKNRKVEWAYQFQKQLARIEDTRALCGVYSPHDPEIEMPMRANPGAYYSSIGKSLTCQNGNGSDYQTCGTNTWPSGFKYDCRSANDVFDMHGNVAEVMNLPDNASQLATANRAGGGTERKGSFFVYRNGYPDDCRVRQPYEHYGRYATDQMSYYQEGFRCCKDANN